MTQPNEIVTPLEPKLDKARAVVWEANQGMSRTYPKLEYHFFLPQTWKGWKERQASIASQHPVLKTDTPGRSCQLKTLEKSSGMKKDMGLLAISWQKYSSNSILLLLFGTKIPICIQVKPDCGCKNAPNAKSSLLWFHIKMKGKFISEDF